MIYLFSRCYGGLFCRHMIILKLFYLLYTSFMLNDQSTDCVVLKAKLQQLPSMVLFSYTCMVLRILIIRPYIKAFNASASL